MKQGLRCRLSDKRIREIVKEQYRVGHTDMNIMATRAIKQALDEARPTIVDVPEDKS